MKRGYFDRPKGFRDPIHGFIKVYEAEREIINTPAFQRLRRIKQLGLTCMVYHGADHTRFAHSLGVMELATRVFDVTVSKDTKGDNLLKWGDEDIERNKVLLRLVALLHDIGHAPFSHSGEEGGLFPDQLTHEDFSAKIIAEDPEINGVITGLRERFDIDVTVETIINFILGKEPEPFLQQIISGPLDADKMDYLWRDSYYAGVYYGRFDIDRLTNTLAVVYNIAEESPALGIEIGGLYVAEALILARYYMFLQVYFHEVRRAYDFLLADFMQTILPEGKFPLEVKDYLKHDDYSVFHKLKEEIDERDENKDLAEAIFNRRHLKKVREIPTVNPSQKEINFFKDRYKQLKEEFPAIRIDGAEDAPNKFEREPFYIRDKDSLNESDRWVEIDKRSELVKRLDQIIKYRVYAPDDENLEKTKKRVNELRWEP